MGTVTRDRLPSVAVRCEDVVHIYKSVDTEVIALRSVDLVIEAGETALLGPSGAGKSTLLWLLAGLRRPSAGRIYIQGQDLTRLPTRRLDELRSAEVGVLLQEPARNLLPYLSGRENIAFAQRAGAWRRRSAAARHAGELLDAVGEGCNFSVSAVTRHDVGRAG
jgi:putative ABC transport system ATP-binding protein